MDPTLIDRPVSGQYRIACGEPCEVVSFDGYFRQGRAWDVSVAGVYAAVPAPFPHVRRTCARPSAWPPSGWSCVSAADRRRLRRPRLSRPPATG
jgi:hypothetical protein